MASASINAPYGVFVYRWHHVPSGASGTKEIACGALYLNVRSPDGLRVRTRTDALELVNHWNTKEPETWQYALEG